MTLPFEMLAEGVFAENELIFESVSDGIRSDSTTQQLIEAAWRPLEKQGRVSRALCRLVDYHQGSGYLNLIFGRTEFKELVGTNLTHPELMQTHGVDYLSNATGVCSVVVTTDSKLAVQVRSASTFPFPGLYHVCGGNLEIDQHEGGHCPPFDGMRRELDEEFAIESGQILDMRCIGLARDKKTLKPELLFATYVAVTGSTILNVQSDEHREIVLLPASGLEFDRFLRGNHRRFVPVGLACLIRFGTWQFGPGWFDMFVRFLEADKIDPDG
jgi:hypothetical protein